MKLRDYQTAAIDACYQHLREHEDNPCIVLPTGAGKTPVMAQIVKDAVTRWHGRVMILAHRKELLQQTVDKLQRICPEVVCGVYSAGLKSRMTDQPCIVAGIQSVYQRACEFGAFNLILVDEAHRIPKDGAGQYRQFIQDAKVVNPKVRIVGLTATPYRATSGNICTPKGILNSVCYDAEIRGLIAQGYLSKVVSYEGDKDAVADTSGVGMVGKEFNLGELEEAFNTSGLVGRACADIASRSGERRKILIFCCGISHAESVSLELARLSGQYVGLLTGETPAQERAELISAFRDGDLRWLVNVNVLTEGFDAPNVDCVALVRATCSPGFYYQMAGRGLRVDDGKNNCLILDYGENIMRHGPIDDIRIKEKKKGTGEAPVKFCPDCEAAQPTARRVCSECQYEWPEVEPNHIGEAEQRFGALSGAISYDRWVVDSVGYYDHRKRGAPEGHPHTLWVEYRCGLSRTVSEWICFEHPIGNFARTKAEGWWKKRAKCGGPAPRSVAEIIDIAREILVEPIAVHVKIVSGKQYPEITKAELPEFTPDCDYETAPPDRQADKAWISDDEIPF